jgi:non-homologous end joining protein Ku
MEDIVNIIIEEIGEYTPDKCPDKYYEAVTDLLWEQLEDPRVLPYEE